MKTFLFTIISIFSLSLSFAQLSSRGTEDTIYTQNVTQVIDTNNLDNPIRDGTFSVIDNEKTKNNWEDPQQVNWIINIWQIDQHQEAQENVLNIIKNIINYALGALWLIALIYLIAHWFMIVTAAGDDEKYKKGLKGIKYAAIAMIGIGLSFFVISMVFRIINYISGQWV